MSREEIGHYVRLLRVKNLALYTVVLSAIEFGLILPLAHSFNLGLGMSLGQFSIFMVACLLLIGASAVINDYFDTRIDAINYPEKQIVGASISRENALFFHHGLVGLGILLGVSLMWSMDKVSFSFLFIVFPGISWFYASSYKRQFILGNLMAVVMAIAPIFLLALVETSQIRDLYSGTYGVRFIAYFLWGVLGIFISLWGLLILVYQIMKDQLSEFGDRELEIKTIPIAIGRKGTRYLLIVLHLIFLITLFLCYHFYVNEIVSYTLLVTITFAIAFPTAISLVNIIKRKHPIYSMQMLNFSIVSLPLLMLYNLYYGEIFITF